MRSARIPVTLPAKVVTGDCAYRAGVVNLSATGAFMQASFPVGALLEIQLPLPGGQPLHLAARVVRKGSAARFVDHPSVGYLAVRAHGVGIAFQAMAPADTQRLSGYLDLIHDRS